MFRSSGATWRVKPCLGSGAGKRCLQVSLGSTHRYCHNHVTDTCVMSLVTVRFAARDISCRVTSTFCTMQVNVFIQSTSRPIVQIHILQNFNPLVIVFYLSCICAVTVVVVVSYLTICSVRFFTRCILHWRGRTIFHTVYMYIRNILILISFVMTRCRTRMEWMESHL